MTRSGFRDRSDAELLIASRRDPDAFVELYDRWARPLLGFFVRRVRDPEVAADLVAETLAVVFEKRARFRDTGAPASAWLYVIASRELSRYFRRQRVEMRAFARLGVALPAVDTESASAIEALVNQDADADPLADAIAEMSKSEQDAVQLRVVEQLDYREIAVRLNCSVIAARVRVHRGLARLNKLMGVVS
jgi:RNA polymerase sigma-70 factor, ECF subfamily